MPLLLPVRRSDALQLIQDRLVDLARRPAGQEDLVGAGECALEPHEMEIIACQHVVLRATSQHFSFLPLGPCPAALRERASGQKLSRALERSEPCSTTAEKPASSGRADKSPK